MTTKHYTGERVIVRHNGREARGWLQSVDETAVVVRLPSAADPERPGTEVAVFICPPKPKWVAMVTCTAVYDHHGISIGYVDPTWSRTEQAAREWAAWLGGRDMKDRVRRDMRVRQISLTVPLQEARIWNDHARMTMWEQAEAELAAEIGGGA